MKINKCIENFALSYKFPTYTKFIYLSSVPQGLHVSVQTMMQTTLHLGGGVGGGGRQVKIRVDGYASHDVHSDPFINSNNSTIDKYSDY